MLISNKVRVDKELETFLEPYMFDESGDRITFSGNNFELVCEYVNSNIVYQTDEDEETGDSDEIKVSLADFLNRIQKFLDEILIIYEFPNMGNEDKIEYPFILKTWIVPPRSGEIICFSPPRNVNDIYNIILEMISKLGGLRKIKVDADYYTEKKKRRKKK